MSATAIEDLITQRVTEELMAQDTNAPSATSCTKISSTINHLILKELKGLIVGHNAAYGIPWKALMKMMTEAYCSMSKIKKLEFELWNLTVKGIDVERYISLIDITPSTLDNSYGVELADEKIIEVNPIIWGCTLNLLNHPFNIDIMPVELGSFDAIIGMDWLSKYHSVIFCDEKIVRIPYHDEKYMLKRCHVFLSHITEKKTDDKSEEKRLEDVSIMRDFPKVFLKGLPGVMPTQQVEFQIDLVPSAAPVVWPPYRLAPSEMIVLMDRFRCVEFNKLTVKNRYPLQRIDDSFDQLQGSSFYSKIDMRSGYHQLRVHEEDILRTTFRTHYCHYEFQVMPFGLINAPVKSLKCEWGDKDKAAFQLLKQKLYRASILALPKGTKNFVVIVMLRIKILNAQAEVIKEENVKEENLHGMNKDFEARPDGTLCIKKQKITTYVIKCLTCLKVIVDLLTKSAYILPMKETDMIDRLTRLYLKEMVSSGYSFWQTGKAKPEVEWDEDEDEEEEDSEEDSKMEEEEEDPKMEEEKKEMDVDANEEWDSLELVPLTRRRLFTNTQVYIGSSSSATACHDPEDLTLSYIRSHLNALHQNIRQIEKDDVCAKNNKLSMMLDYSEDSIRATHRELNRVTWLYRHLRDPYVAARDAALFLLQMTMIQLLVRRCHHPSHKDSLPVTLKEIQRMEHELWNLKVKDFNMPAYTQRFHELALLCTEMVQTERKKIDAYNRGLTDNIKGEVTLSKPTSLNEVVRMRLVMGVKRKDTQRTVSQKRNDLQGEEARGRAYVINDAKKQQGPNVVTDLMLFRKRKDGSFRMYIDYHELNKLTVKNSYPLPRIDDLFDQLQSSSVYSKIDLRTTYHQLRIREEDIPITAFRTRYSHYKFQVMPYGLTNAPVVFTNLMNRVCKPYLDKFMIVFIDDILIYSKSKEEHEEYLKTILKLLKKEQLFAKILKCDFCFESIQFLSHVINSKGVHIDPAMTEAIRNWATPTTPTEARQFLGLAGYYQRFIEGFSLISKPLTKLTQKNKKYEWGKDEEEAFQLLKQKLCCVPILALFEWSEDFVVYCDASLKRFRAVLMQREKL
nr:putative reverse transcriptase domain-containing protein [Tanacetum cinerariifolium]